MSKKAYFPMFVSLERKPCLVIGGGRVAARKCRGLLAFGADVTVIAKEFCETEQVFQNAELHTIKRDFREEDLERTDWTLVVAATDDRAVNSRIAVLCHDGRLPVNVADCQEECSFFFPAYCIRDNVAAGITTSGTSPVMAASLRRRLEACLPGWIRETERELDENG